MPRRFVVLHRHIFKNAGSSVDAALQGFFGDKFTEFHSNTKATGTVFPHELIEYLDAHENVVAVSSHHFHGINYRAFLDSKLQANYWFFEMVLIRHPIARLISMYHYYRALGPSDDQIQQAAVAGTLAEFLTFLVNQFPNIVINPQVTMFADHFIALPDQRQLEHAFSRLLQFNALGIVERYEESITLAEYLLQPLYGPIDLSGPKVNQSMYPTGPRFDGTSSTFEKVVGKPLSDYLFHSNSLDIELWQLVNRELTRRASYVPEFQIKLMAFRNKCVLKN